MRVVDAERRHDVQETARRPEAGFRGYIVHPVTVTSLATQGGRQASLSSLPLPPA
jgi:hypothetical protein